MHSLGRMDQYIFTGAVDLDDETMDAYELGGERDPRINYLSNYLYIITTQRMQFFQVLQFTLQVMSRLPVVN